MASAPGPRKVMLLAVSAKAAGSSGFSEAWPLQRQGVKQTGQDQSDVLPGIEHGFCRADDNAAETVWVSNTQRHTNVPHTIRC